MLFPWKLPLGAEPVPYHRHACFLPLSFALVLPPLALLGLKPTSDEAQRHGTNKEKRGEGGVS